MFKVPINARAVSGSSARFAIVFLWAVIFGAYWPASARWINVASEWDAYHLNDLQRQWFTNVRPKRPGPRCCDIADGHPTQAERRADGWYIPNPFHPDRPWVKVPEEAFTEGGTNPVGVATVWFAGEQDGGIPYIRCFVPEAEG